MRFSSRRLRRRLMLCLAGTTLGTTSAAGCAAGGDQPGPVVVFAAASLQGVLENIARQYQRAGGDSVALVFGSTTDLSEQIANGAPADLLLAADEATIDRLVARTFIVDSTRVVYAVGQLALVTRCDAASARSDTAAAPSCTPLSLQDLVQPSIRFVAIANPAYAPYGVAARQVLDRAALWDRVQAKIVMGANILQADQYVTSGNADAGLIALSLVVEDQKQVFVVIDSSLHDPIRHAGGVVNRSGRHPKALEFLQFMSSSAARETLRAHGLLSPDHTAVP